MDEPITVDEARAYKAHHEARLGPLTALELLALAVREIRMLRGVLCQAVLLLPRWEAQQQAATPDELAALKRCWAELDAVVKKAGV